jgi:CheY-like chemotaxis protein
VAGADRRIICVDDQPSNLDDLVSELENRGATVRVYSDSVRAEEAIKQRAPDVVISDITRGDDPHAGFEFIARLRRTGYEGPVVFFTGRVTAQRRERAEQLNAEFAIVEALRRFNEPTSAFV